MKSTIISLLVVAVCLLSAITSKPSDQEFTERCIAHEVGSSGLIRQLIDVTGIADSAYTIEDDIFFKTAYNRITGDRVGTAFFGTVIFAK